MILKKLLGLGFAAAMFATSQAHAGFINVITGADMAGLKVTATFSNNATETLTWEVISAGNGLTDTVSLESASGGVSSDLFSLSQQGDSMGNFDLQGNFYGLWTLINKSNFAIIEVMISALNTNIVFDTVYDDNGNGSGVGRGYIQVPLGAGTSTATYSPASNDELAKVMTIDLSLQAGGTVLFMADTDAVAVSAPASLSIFALSLLGLAVRSRRKHA